MKFSRDWLSDYIDLTDLSNDEVAARMTEVGHAIEAVEAHGDDTVFDAEITTNRVDAMSHLGMARELAAALGRELLPAAADARHVTDTRTNDAPSVRVAIEAPELCTRFSGVVIRGITIKPSPQIVQRRLEAIGLRPINNVVDVTNYVMMGLGHPLHAYDLDQLAGATLIARAGRDGESLKSLDGETRKIDAKSIVIADADAAVGLGGIIGGASSEIGSNTKNVLLECAHFDSSAIRATAKRLGIKTDASYRFERGIDPNDTASVVDFAASLVVDYAGGTREPIIDVLAAPRAARTIVLRDARLIEASAGVIGAGYALEVFRRLGFTVERTNEALSVVVPTYRGDIFEEMDLVEEVLRFYGINNIPSSLPRVTIGDVRRNVVVETEDRVRDILAGCGFAEAVNYGFIHPEYNALFSAEQPANLLNALTENVASMRVSLIPGLLDNVAYNRSYGTRDGALFEVGRTYHRGENETVRERSRAAFVLFGNVGSHWGDAKRPVDFFDAKGVVEQIAKKLHVELTFDASDDAWLRRGKRAVARHADRVVAHIGYLGADVLQRFGLKSDVVVAELDVDALIAATSDWKMTQVARHPGIPMVLGFTHGRDLEYQRLIDTIRGLGVPHLHEVGLRDRFVPDGESNEIKTTLGMWYQAFDRSLTQEEVAQSQQQLSERVAAMLPVKLIS